MSMYEEQLIFILQDYKSACTEEQFKKAMNVTMHSIRKVPANIHNAEEIFVEAMLKAASNT